MSGKDDQNSKTKTSSGRNKTTKGKNSRLFDQRLSVDSMNHLLPAYRATGPWMRRRRRLYVFGSSVRAAVRASVRPSVILLVVLCFRDISSIY